MVAKETQHREVRRNMTTIMQMQTVNLTLAAMLRRTQAKHQSIILKDLETLFIEVTNMEIEIAKMAEEFNIHVAMRKIQRVDIVKVIQNTKENLKI